MSRTGGGLFEQTKAPLERAGASPLVHCRETHSWPAVERRCRRGLAPACGQLSVSILGLCRGEVGEAVSPIGPSKLRAGGGYSAPKCRGCVWALPLSIGEGLAPGPLSRGGVGEGPAPGPLSRGGVGEGLAPGPLSRGGVGEASLLHAPAHSQHTQSRACVNAQTLLEGQMGKDWKGGMIGRNQGQGDAHVLSGPLRIWACAEQTLPVRHGPAHWQALAESRTRARTNLHARARSHAHGHAPRSMLAAASAAAARSSPPPRPLLRLRLAPSAYAGRFTSRRMAAN